MSIGYCSTIRSYVWFKTNVEIGHTTLERRKRDTASILIRNNGIICCHIHMTYYDYSYTIYKCSKLL